MHPDGVFVFLSLLIYGGLFSTQEKNLHFNFHYLYLSPQHSSPGRELTHALLPSCPTLHRHQGEYRSRGGTGAALWEQAHATEISSEIYVCLCPTRTPGTSGPVSHPFLDAVMEGKGSSPVSCLVPNTAPHLLTHSARNSSQQESKEDLDMLGLVPTGDSPPCLLHSSRGGRRACGKPSLEDSSLPSFLQGCPCSDNRSLQADSYPKSTESIANVLDRWVKQGSESHSPS